MKNIPNELEVGDKVMFVSHGRIAGITDVKEVKGLTVILTKPHNRIGNEIPKKINGRGYIITEGVFDIFIYTEIVCNNLGLKFNRHNSIQKDICRALSKRFSAIEFTNDITSPTHYSDNAICVQNLGLSETDEEDMINIFNNLFNLIKSV